MGTWTYQVSFQFGESEQKVGGYGNTGLPTNINTRKYQYAYHRNSEVVQRCKGFWFHHA